MFKTKFNEEGKKTIRETYINIAIFSPLAYLVMAGFAYCLINNKIDFSRYQNIRVQNLSEIGPRIQYVLQHSTPGVLWLLFCTFYVISKRVNTPAVNPTSGYEHLTESAKSIFLNSLEQFVMSLTSQLILVSYLTPGQVLNIIPVINILFIVGRITFWLGYPMRRMFGMIISLVPNSLMMFYIGYRYIRLFC